MNTTLPHFSSLCEAATKGPLEISTKLQNNPYLGLADGTPIAFFAFREPLCERAIDESWIDCYQRTQPVRRAAELEGRATARLLALGFNHVGELVEALEAYLDAHANYEKQRDLGVIAQRITARIGMELARDQARAALSALEEDCK